MIIGERVRFRSIERKDLPQFVEWLNDPEVRIHIAAYLPMSVAREEMWFEEMMKRPPEEHGLAIEARNGTDWKLIGSCGLTDINWQERSAELGIMIGDKEEWNKGYGTDAMRLLLKHGFETLNLYRLYLHVYEDNARALRSYEKAGFVQEGRMRHARYEQGHYTDVLSMSMLRSEWDENK